MCFEVGSTTICFKDIMMLTDVCMRRTLNPKGLIEDTLVASRKRHSSIRRRLFTLKSDQKALRFVLPHASECRSGFLQPRVAFLIPVNLDLPSTLCSGDFFQSYPRWTCGFARQKQISLANEFSHEL